MAKRGKSQPYSLLADLPVENANSDQLGRAHFAKSLAQTIKSMKGADTFVFGLCGQWGTGKSSVLNLVVQELEAGRSKSKPLILRFNPWWYSGQDQLLRSFLAQLASVLGRADAEAGLNTLSEKLSTFGKVLRPLSWIPGAGIVREVADVMDAGAEGAKKIADAITTDVSGLRAEIDTLLRKASQRIVIVMDDIDRLTAEEIAQLFLIVKAVADFPNTVYLLAFDHGVVCKAISTALGLDGVAYLEKIVQIQVDLPPPGSTTLHSMFLEQAGALLDESVATHKAKQDFGNLFHAGIADFFVTPRSVKRLTNVLRVLLPSVKGEVYWPDFFAICSLMVFAPDAYRVVRDNKEYFAGLEEHWGTNRGDSKAFHETWLKHVPASAQSSVRKLLARLFPKFSWAFGGSSYASGFLSQWRAELRACSPERFDRYFQLRVDESDFSEAEWQRVVSALPDATRLEKILASYCRPADDQQRTVHARAFLDRAQLFAKHHATPESARQLFAATLRLSDVFIARTDLDYSAWVPVTNLRRVDWLLHACLSSLPDREARELALEECLSDDVGLCMATELQWFLGSEHGKYGAELPNRHDEPLVSLESVERLEARLLTRLRSTAADDSLLAVPRIVHTVHNWDKISPSGEAVEWVRRVCIDDACFLSLASQLRSRGSISGLGDYVATEYDTIDATTLIEWFGGVEVRERALTLISNARTLSDEDCTTLNLIVSHINEKGDAVDALRPARRLSRLGARNESNAEVQQPEEAETQLDEASGSTGDS